MHRRNILSGLVKLACATPPITAIAAGFIVAEKGGVVRLAELQSQGYSYLRP